MYELSVKTATGKEFEVDHFAESMASFPHLFIEFLGKNIAEIVSIFSQAEETTLITGFEEGTKVKQYSGYTNLSEAFIVPGTTNIRIRLDAPVEVYGQ